MVQQGRLANLLPLELCPPRGGILLRFVQKHQMASPELDSVCYSICYAEYVFLWYPKILV